MEKGDDWSVVAAAFGVLRKTPLFRACTWERDRPLFSPARENGNDRFSDNRWRGVTRRSPVLGTDESRLLVIIYCRFLVVNDQRSIFLPFISSRWVQVTPPPRGAKVNVFAVLRLSEPVFTVSVSTTRRRKPQYRSLRSVYLTLSTCALRETKIRVGGA